MASDLVDYCAAAQQAAEKHLAACEWAMEGDGGSPALEPFCGCTTCVVREVLNAAWPILVAGVRAELRLERAS